MRSSGQRDGMAAQSGGNWRATRWALGLVMAGWVVAATGCSPNISAGPAAAPGVTPLRLAFFPNITHAPALVGTGRGTFARVLGPGVAIHEQIYTAGPSEIEGVFADQVDIGYIGPGPAVNGFLKSHGEALKVIAGASSGGTALVVRVDAAIADTAGLARKRVAVPQTGGTQDISLRHALQTAGLNSTDKGGTVNVLPNAPADTLTLFVKKELDAAWVAEPWVSRLVKEGNGKVLEDERDLWPGKKFATTLVIVRSKFLRDHADIVAKYLEAHVETVDWINTHPEEARTIVGERLKKLTGKALPPEILKSAFERTDITYDPLRETVLTFADWSKDLGYLKQDRTALGGLIDVQPLNAVLAKNGKSPIP